MINELIKKIELDKMALLSEGSRLSSNTFLKKWEPSFKIEFGEKTFKVRLIKNSIIWEERKRTIQKINAITQFTLPSIFYVGEKFSISEYISGYQLTNDTVNFEELAHTFKKFHFASHESIKTEVSKETIFANLSRIIRESSDYVSVQKLLNENELNSLNRCIDSYSGKCTIGAAHTDLSVHNVVTSTNETYRIIDIEGLTFLPLEYDFAKLRLEIFSNNLQNFFNVYDDLIIDYLNNQKYWNCVYLLRKVMERHQIENKNGLERARSNLRQNLL